MTVDSTARPLNLQNLATLLCTDCASLTQSVHGSHSFTGKKNPGLFQDFQGPPWEIFQDLFGAHECLNIKKKHQTGTFTISACFPLEPIKMRNFQGYFSRTFQDLKLQFPWLSRTKVLFQNFPGPGIFKKKIQDFPGGVGTLSVMP